MRLKHLPTIALILFSSLAWGSQVKSKFMTNQVTPGSCNNCSTTYDSSGRATAYSSGSGSAGVNSATVSFIQSGGTTVGTVIDGVRRVKNSSTLTAIYMSVANVLTAGTIAITLNYGPTLGSSLTASWTTSGTGAQTTSISESTAVTAGDIQSIDVTSVTGNAQDLTVELVY